MPRISQRASLVVAVGIGIWTLPLYGQAPADQAPVAPPPQSEEAPRQEPIAPQALQATQHPVLPQSLDDFWLVPSAKERAAAKDSALEAAAQAYTSGDYSSALAASRRSTGTGPLSQYALFYQGLSNLRLSRAADADKAFDDLIALNPDGYLSVGALLGKAEGKELAGDHGAAADLYSGRPRSRRRHQTRS